MTRLQKIETLKTLEEIEGFRWGAKVSGNPLDPDEVNALIRLEKNLRERKGNG